MLHDVAHVFLFYCSIMDAQFRAEKLYRQKRFNTTETTLENSSNLLEVKNLLHSFLTTCSPCDRFRYPVFLDVIKHTAESGNRDMHKASKAFESIELIVCLIWHHPWRLEYRTLKKYSGFYHSKIDIHLQNAEWIFRLLNYNEYGCLLICNNLVSMDTLQEVGFQCLVASVECSIIYNIYNSVMDPRITAIDVYKLRELRGEEEGVLVADLRKKLFRSSLASSSSGSASAKLPRTPQLANSTFSSRSPMPAQENKEETYNNNLELDLLPYADEGSEKVIDQRGKTPEYVEGTVDDHIMASLKLVSAEEDALKKEIEAEKKQKASEQWDFVRQDLQRQFGEEYFDGTRGNILKPSEQSESNFKRQDLRRQFGGDNYFDGTQGNIMQQPEPVTVPYQIVSGRYITQQGKSSKLDSGIGESTSYSDGYALTQNTSSQSLTRRSIQPRSIVQNCPHPLLSNSKSIPPRSNTHSTYPLLPQGQLPPESAYNIYPVSEMDTPSSTRAMHIINRNTLGRPLMGDKSMSFTDPIASRPKPKKGTDELDGVYGEIWECLYCTYKNRADQTVCEMCSKSRGVTCPECTVWNQRGSSVCTVCQKSLIHF